MFSATKSWGYWQTQIAVPWICNPKNADIRYISLHPKSTGFSLFYPKNVQMKAPQQFLQVLHLHPPIPSPSIQRWRVSLCHRHVRDRPPHLEMRRGDCMKIPGIFIDDFPNKYIQIWWGLIRYDQISHISIYFCLSLLELFPLLFHLSILSEVWCLQ